MKRMAVVAAALLIAITGALAGCIYPEGDDYYGDNGYYHHDRGEGYHRGEHREHHDEGRGGRYDDDEHH